MACEKNLPTASVTYPNGDVTNKKCYIYSSTRLMATKLDKVMAYGYGPSRTKSHDSLIT